mmetsp:Transcript_23063/g.53362  ORF Transcript_23063/g.53362 Transcript_23063/m.53362 type:complete len:468 (+) Transcript_23063:51-1454(+)
MAPMKRAPLRVVKRKMKKVQISPTKGKLKARAPRQDRGRLAAIKATKMTKEEWYKYQTPKYKLAWPKPEYMGQPRSTTSLGPDGATCPYRDETFEIVTRWTKDTKIRYRPHAKAPGSKSHIRYEKYSKAKTVGQALALGSYPIDWIYDYEHGFIEVLGGHIRDEPIDRSKVEHDWQLTAVDKAIMCWFMKELAKRCNLSIAELRVEKGYFESVFMRAHRLCANRLAGEVMEEARKKKRPISSSEVYEVLKAWTFQKNTNRQNVLPQGQDFVKSDTLGVLRDRFGNFFMNRNTREYPNVPKIIARWLRDHMPREVKHFHFTSINLNCNYAARRHRDGNNFGPSMIKAFGEFTGGKLVFWPEDDRSSKIPELPYQKRVTLDIAKNLAMFNGNSAHEVEAFKGNRFSVVYFTIRAHAKIPAEFRKKLMEMDFALPKKDEERYSMIRPPRGYNSKAPLKDKKPVIRTWPMK